MPIYAYRCNDCEYEFEVRQRMADDPLEACPECEGEVRRVVNSVGVVFKGSGFYITDNRSGRSGTSSSSAATTDSSSDKPAKKESKSDTKSDVKTTSKATSKTT